MNTYIVRSKAGEANKPYVGMFCANNRFELFDAVDEFGDPAAFEYARLTHRTGLLLSINREFSLSVDGPEDDGMEFEADSFGCELYGMAYKGTRWRNFPCPLTVYDYFRPQTAKD